MKVACAGWVETAAFQELFNQIDGEYLLTEKLDDLRLVKYEKGSIKLEPEIWTSGRIFGKMAELRWESVEGQIHFRYIGPSAAWITAKYEQLPLAEYDCAIRSFYLWGKRSGSMEQVWREMRIPRALTYPIKSTTNSRVVLTVEEYCHRDRQQPGFTRFCGLMEVKG